MSEGEECVKRVVSGTKGVGTHPKHGTRGDGYPTPMLLKSSGGHHACGRKGGGTHLFEMLYCLI